MSVRTPIPAGSETRRSQESGVLREGTPATEQTHELVDFDRYVVSRNGPVGYVEVVSHVFVCYLGHPFAQAEEIGQVLDLEQAVQMVSEQARVSGRPKLAP